MNLTNIDAAIYSRLSGGTALIAALGGTAIYYEVAPENATLPYVICNIVSRIDDNQSRNRTQNILAFIRAYASTPVQANAIDENVDALMHDNPLTITGATNFWCMREDSFSGQDLDQATRRTYYSGAQYRVRIDI